MHRAPLCLAVVAIATACAGGPFSRRTAVPATPPDVGTHVTRAQPAGVAVPGTPEEGKEMLAREYAAMDKVEASLDSLRRARGTVEGSLQDLELGGGPTRGRVAARGSGGVASAAGGGEVAAVPTTGAAHALSVTRLYFPANSATLSETVKRLLVEKAEILRAHPSLSITVVGHADDRGSDDDNFALSERRADAVRRFLLSRGIEEHRLLTTGLGRQEPAAAGAGNPKTRNRRVEFDVRSM